MLIVSFETYRNLSKKMCCNFSADECTCLYKHVCANLLERVDDRTVQLSQGTIHVHVICTNIRQVCLNVCGRLKIVNKHIIRYLNVIGEVGSNIR